MRNLSGVVITAACILLIAVQTAPAADEKSQVGFEKQIRPLLKQHCYDCHSQGAEESGLRVDYGANLIKGGDRGPAVVPGKRDESLLYLSLKGEGKIPRMPHDLPPLKPAEIELIGRWIDDGGTIPASEQNLQTVDASTDH